MKRFLLAACVLPVFVGCQQYYLREGPPALPAEEVVELSKQGLTADEIITRIQKSRTIYDMDFEDGLKLKEQGVDAKVIDYMMKSRDRVIYRRAYYDHYPYYYPYVYPRVGFYYGPHYCW